MADGQLVPIEPTEVPGDLPEDTMVSYDPTRTVRIPPIGSGHSATLAEPPDSLDDSEGEDPAQQDLPSAARNYILRRIVGTGGFGEVWEAQQRSLGRLVAIKRLRDEIVEDSASPISIRHLHSFFRQEALTTAALEHPNIVPVHDLGLDANGRPVMAMKLVKGRPWSQIILEDTVLPDDQFFAKQIPILIDVTQAVAFAHSRGVVHRDLKPQQVMVGEYGEVLLMDWGLALAFDIDVLSSNYHGETEEIAPTLHTGTNPAGTVAYMAPEQTEMTCKRIGPKTDVWLLGGMLYYLLTLTPPHSAPDRTAAFIQARAGIVDTPEERAPGRVLAPELCALAMRSLAADPDDRPTAIEFLDGLREYVSGEARHRESLALTALVAEGLNEKPRSYGRFAELDNQLVRAVGLWATNPEIPALRARVLEAYGRQALLNGDLVLARAQGEALAPCDTREILLAEVADAEASLRAQRIQRRILIAVSVVLMIGVAALAVYANARAEDAVAAQAIADRARARAVDTRDRAEDLLSYLLIDFSGDLESLGRLELLESVAQRALAYYKDIPDEDLDGEALRQRGLVLFRMGTIFHRRGDLEQALASYRAYGVYAARAAERLPKNPRAQADLAGSPMMVGQVLQERGELDAAQKEFDRAVDVMRRIVKAEPQDSTTRLLLGTGLVNSAVNLHMSGLPDQAAQRLNEAVDLLTALQEKRPDVASVAGGLGSALNNLGMAYESLGRLDDALAAQQRSLALRLAVVKKNPGNVAFLDAAARTYLNLGHVHSALGQIDEAIDASRKSIEMRADLLEIEPTNQVWIQAQNRSQVTLASMLIDAGRPTEALTILRHEEPVAREMTTRAVESMSALLDLARLLESEGRAMQRLGDYVKARDCYLESIDLHRQHVEKAPGATAGRALADAMSNLASLAEEQGDMEEALVHQRGAFALAEDQLGKTPEDPSCEGSLARHSRILGRMLSASGDREGAVECWQRTVDLLDAQRERGLQLSVFGTADLAVALIRLGDRERGMALAETLRLAGGEMDRELAELIGETTKPAGE